MKALFYFILFYASIFLISMIPDENIEADQNTAIKSERIFKSDNSHKTSYAEFSDSIKNAVRL